MHRKARLPLLLLLAAASLGATSAFEWPIAVRFVHAELNNWAAALIALSIPACVVWAGATVPHRTIRYIVFLLAGGLSVFSLFFSVLAVRDDGSNPLQDSLAVGRATYRVYMRGGGSASSQPFTVLREEFDLLGLVKLVRPVWSSDRYGQARLRAIDGSTLEVEIDGDFFRQRVAI